MKELKLKAGDWVEVKSPAEIAATLDQRSTLDGLPFMPEMVEHCGSRFRVSRVAHKTCVEIEGRFLMREMRNPGIVLLDGLRCSGSSHDGCQRQCMFFWNTAWLRAADGEETRGSSPADAPAEAERLRSSLKTKVTADRYFCQSTELQQIVDPRSIRKLGILKKAFRDVWTGAVGPIAMAMLIVMPLYRKVRDKLVGRPFLVGTLKKTPVGALELQPGERVKIKPLNEIQATLDSRGRNRGLVADIELEQFCGMNDRVLTRLDRMISESTGEMKKVEGTVILEGNKCLCARALGGCPRQEFCYWREVWLDRAGEK